jgi:hypothetical protein
MDETSVVWGKCDVLKEGPRCSRVYEPRNSGVIRGRGCERISSKLLAEGQQGAPLVLFHAFHQFRVLRWRGADDHRLVVLGGGTKHGRTANVNIFDARIEVATLLKKSTYIWVDYKKKRQGA